MNAKTSDVKLFGAAGDGVTDDTSAIQNAIAAANLVHGEVYFGPGTYLSAGFTLPSGVSLRGLTRESVELVFSGTGGAITLDSDSTGSSIKELRIVSTVPGFAIDGSHGIVRDFIVDNVKCNCTNGVAIVNGLQVSIRNMRIVGGISAPAAGTTGVLLQGGNGMTVEDVYVHGFNYGIDQYSDAITIIRPILETNNTGIVSRSRSSIISPWSTPNAGANLTDDIEVLTDDGISVIGSTGQNIFYSTAAARTNSSIL